MKVSYKNGVPAVSLRQDDGYTVSHQQPARVPVYPPYSGYTVAGCGPWSGLFQQLLNQRRVAWV